MSVDSLRKHRATSKVASVIALIARRAKLVEELTAIDAQIEAGWTSPQPIQRQRRGPKLKYQALEPTVVKLTRAGRTERQIANQLKIPHATVHNIQRRHGVSNGTTKRGGKRNSR